MRQKNSFKDITAIKGTGTEDQLQKPSLPRGSFRGSCCYLVAESCMTLLRHMDCNLPGSSVLGIAQARIVGCQFLPQGIFLTQGLNAHLHSCIAGEFFTIEPPGKPHSGTERRVKGRSQGWTRELNVCNLCNDRFRDLAELRLSLQPD